MEVKGTLRRLGTGWICEGAGTAAGQGATPEAAYYDWMRLLHAPREDAYDDIQRAEHRLEHGA